jgi:hypothetical protein
MAVGRGRLRASLRYESQAGAVQRMQHAARCSSSQRQPHTALQLRLAVAFTITFITAALLRSASRRLLPRLLVAFVPPKPLAVPTCRAPSATSRLACYIIQHSQSQPSIALTCPNRCDLRQSAFHRRMPFCAICCRCRAPTYFSELNRLPLQCGVFTIGARV